MTTDSEFLRSPFGDLEVITTRDGAVIRIDFLGPGARRIPQTPDLPPRCS